MSEDKNSVKITLKAKIGLVLFGIFLFLVILESGLRLGEFAIMSLQEQRNSVFLKQKNAYRIMCLGESTTQLGGENAYPAQLERILNARSADKRYVVINKGVTGIDTNGIIAGLEASLEKYKPDMVAAMMGINDSWSSQVFYPASAPKVLRAVYRLKTWRLARLVAMHALARFRSFKPLNSEDYIRSANEHLDNGSLREAKLDFMQAYTLSPRDKKVCYMIGLIEHCLGNFDLAEVFFKKAIAIDNNYYDAYLELGWCLRDKGSYSVAEEVLKNAIALAPDRGEGYFELGVTYRGLDKITEAQDAFKKALFFAPDSDAAAAALTSIYEEFANPGESRKFAELARDLREKKFGAVTAGNFFKLSRICRERKIALAIVGYPIRSIAALKNIFADQQGIIFVDNESLFKQVVASGGYRKYFSDMFAGDFGHCTAIGNRLLAESVAAQIIKFRGNAH